MMTRLNGFNLGGSSHQQGHHRAHRAQGRRPRHCVRRARRLRAGCRAVHVRRGGFIVQNVFTFLCISLRVDCNVMLGPWMDYVQAMVAALGNAKEYTLKQYLAFADKLQAKAKV